MARLFGGNAAIAGVVERPRLFQILESPLVRICVIQGPSGSGKTTLLRSWAPQRTRRAPLIWVSLNSEVTSRQAFWHQVLSSAVRLGEVAGDVADGIRERLAFAADPVGIATDLIAAAGPVILALDAYEHLGAVTAQIDRDLAHLVAAAPELRVLITTRGSTQLAEVDPPVGVVRVVSLSELSLSADEVATLVEAQTGIADARLAQSIVEATRGFPLTVRAVTLALSQLGQIPMVDSTEWNTVVATRMESLLPDRLAVQFVTDTSIPPYVDLELAEQLSDGIDVAAQLDMLERNGFGRWIPYTRNRQVFQYVETIRDTFRARALLDPDRYHRSCVIIAAWLLENEEVVEHALQFAIDGKDYALADRVFVSVVISNPDSYTSDRFLSSLENVPEDMLEAHPMLAFGLGLALMANLVRRAEAPRIFQIAVDSTASPSYIHPAIDSFSLASMRAISRRLARNWRSSADHALEAVREGEALDPRLLAEASEHVGTILRQLSYSLWQGGKIPEAIAVAERSMALCARPAPRDYSAVYDRALHAFSGDTVRSGILAASIDEKTWSAEVRRRALSSMGLLADAYVRLDALDFAGALEAIRPTREFLVTSEHWPLMTTVGVIARRGLGQAHAEADRVTREIAATVPPPGVGDNVATECLHAALAWAWMDSGDTRQAAALLEGPDEESPYLVPARVAVLLATRRDSEALAVAERVLAAEGHTIRTRAETETIGAVAALRQGRVDLAEAWLTRAFVAWDAYGSRVHVALLDVRDWRQLWEFTRARGSADLQRYLDVPRPPRMRRATTDVALTKRESIVLSALVETASVRDIAERLVVSPHTVKSQLQSVYRKLGVSSRLAAITTAQDLGLLDPPHAQR